MFWKVTSLILLITVLFLACTQSDNGATPQAQAGDSYNLTQLENRLAVLERRVGSEVDLPPMGLNWMQEYEWEQEHDCLTYKVYELRKDVDELSPSNVFR